MDEISRIASQRLGPTKVPTSEDFALLLGFKEVEGARNEFERLYLFRAYLHRCLSKTEPEQDAIWAQFCASYLPKTVDRFLDPPAVVHPNSDTVKDFTLLNAYAEMLVAIQHSPYFAKYLRSTQDVAAGGKQLTRVLAQRLSAIGPRWNREMATRRPELSETAGCAVQLLSTLCAAFVKESNQEVVVPLETRQLVMPLLQRWSRERRHDFLGATSRRTHAQLSKNTSIQADARELRRHLKNWNVCGLPGCDATEKLLACGKCKTVRYCSTDHQRQHWTLGGYQSHKKFCYPTVY